MKRIISILLCLCLLAGLLTGCAQADDPQVYVPTGDGLTWDDEDEEAGTVQSGEQQLSLAYYADKNMNPLKATDFTNLMLMPLLYQGLFAVNRNYEVEPMLCSSYTVTADLMTYVFTIDSRATFSDGTPVTSEDVAESLKKAKKSNYYGGRMRYIQKIEWFDDGTVRLKLKQPYENLPILLDIPIVKALEVDEPFPLGTGPYKLAGTENYRFLTKRTNWWCQSKDLLITDDQIPLVAADSVTHIRDQFEFADVGVVLTDPGSDRYVDYRCDYELWDCETGIFVYLGVNKSSSVFKKKEARQALTKGINREYLIDTYYRGFAVGAELPASPNSPYYSQALAQQYAYDPIVFSSLASGAQGKTVRLLVNSDDSLRQRVAQEIGRMLNAGGLIVEVVAVPSSEYRATLEDGKYDLYLGQTKLSANMDLTPFFSADGALNFGGMDNLGIFTQCLQALENQGNYYTLHQAVMDEAYLCPVLFRSYAVYATRGLLTALQPARDNIFSYSIGKNMTQAYSAQSAPEE